MARARTKIAPTTRTRSRRASKAQESATPPGKQVETALATLPYEERGLRGKQRKVAYEAMRLRSEGLTCEEIAKKLGYANGTSISRILSYAGRKGWLTRGWLTTPDIEDHLTYITAHKIVRNIDQDLDNGDLEPGQREMTIAAAKGRGFFKNHETSKGSATPASLILGVKIEVAHPAGTTQIGVDSTQLPRLPAEDSGVPLYVEGSIEAEPQPV